MKKRLLALLLAACMLLAGCGASQQEATGDPTGQVQTTPAPEDDGFTPLVTGQIDDPEQLTTEEQRQLMQSLMDGWYTALAAFRQPELAALFSDEEDAAMHAAALRTLTAIRRQALVDLRMQDVSYTLTVTAPDSRPRSGSSPAKRRSCTSAGRRRGTTPHSSGRGRPCRPASPAARRRP